MLNSFPQSRFIRRGLKNAGAIQVHNMLFCAWLINCRAAFELRCFVVIL